MNNLDRIIRQLASEAEGLAATVGLDPETFLNVVLEIVNAEDEHRISRTNIRQQVRTIVMNAVPRADGEDE